MIQNLTKGNPAKLIVLFCLPLLIGNLFQQLYNITDILIVGRFLGVNALAAVGASAPIFFVFLLISFGFSNGLTVITAQKFGADDLDQMRKSMTHAIMASSVLCIFMTIVLVFFLKPILRVMNVPHEIENEAYTFMSILSIGLVMIVFYNLLSGFVRALGDSNNLDMDYGENVSLAYTSNASRTFSHFGFYSGGSLEPFDASTLKENITGDLFLTSIIKA